MTLQLARPVIDASRRIAHRTPRSSRTCCGARDSTRAGDPDRRPRNDVSGPRRPARAARRGAAASSGRPHHRSTAGPIQFVDVLPRTDGPQGPPVSGGARSRGAARTVWFSAGPGDRGVPARADFTGERADDQLDSRRAAAPARCGWTCIRKTRTRAGSQDGERMRMFNALGEVRVHARVTPLVRRGTVSMPKGVWRRHTAQRADVECAGPRHADRSGRGRVLQRRTRAGRETRDGVSDPAIEDRRFDSDD